MTNHPNIIAARDTPMDLRKALTASRQMVTVCTAEPLPAAKALSQALQARAAFAPLWIDAPMEPEDFLPAWCGIRPPDHSVAQSLVDRSRAILGLEAELSLPVETRWRVESAPGNEDAEASETARHFLLATPVPAAEAVRRGLEQMAISDVERFQRVARLWASECRPIVLVAIFDAPFLAPTINQVVQAVERASEARLFLVLHQHAWRQLEPLLSPHCAALLRQGWTELMPPAEVAESSVDSLHQRARQAVAAAHSAAETPPPQDDRPEYSEARSLAEALLYSALQASPRTTGLFALNAGGGFRFGPRTAEIDLLCQSLGIAIEVDGYFHFQDKDAYRRDRAKDWLMQSHGLLVLRFLAEDVTDDLTAVVARVAEAVSRRRGQKSELEEEGSWD